MNITTKFSLGDVVTAINRGNRQEWVDCPLCLGTGDITVSESATIRRCPECYGKKGKTYWREEQWTTRHTSTIGKVNIELYGDEYDGTDREQYMLASTGVGSGTLWPVDQLWATREEAQAECDRRNADIIALLDARQHHTKGGAK